VDSVKTFLSFLLSASLLFMLVCALWLVDVVRYKPDIPAQLPEGNFIEIIVQKKKHNHVDDFILSKPEFRQSNSQ
jgi:hypothetical protein